MKKISIIATCSVILLSVLVGCGKVLLNYGDITKFDDSQVLLKINYVSQYGNNRSVFLKLNDKRVSGVITARTPYPGGGYNTGGGSTPDFLQVGAGDVKLSVVMPHKIDDGLDSTVLFSTTFKLDGGKQYSIHITDTASTTKTLLLEEDFNRPDVGFSKYHFVHLMPNVPAVDLYYSTSLATAADTTQQRTDSLIVANIPYLQTSPTFLMKSGVLRNWKVRPAGAPKTAATVIATYASSATTVTSQRIYTMFTSGYNLSTVYTGLTPFVKGTATQKPYVSFFLVR